MKIDLDSISQAFDELNVLLEERSKLDREHAKNRQEIDYKIISARAKTRTHISISKETKS